jgi:hypothetical protein
MSAEHAKMAALLEASVEKEQYSVMRLMVSVAYTPSHSFTK